MMMRWLCKRGGCAFLIVGIVVALGQTAPPPKAPSDDTGGGSADDVPKLVKTIKDKDKAKLTRTQAIDALGAIGAEAKAAVPTLRACLSEENLRPNAVAALGKIGPNAKETMPGLIALLLADPIPGEEERKRGRPVNAALLALRPSIIESMTRIGLEPKQCVAPLAAIIAQDNPRLQGYRGFREGCLAAVKAVEPLGSKAKDAVPALVQLLDNKAAWRWNPQGPREAIIALGKIGPDAKLALPALRKRLNHDDPSVAKSAEAAIDKIMQPVAAKPPAEVETPKEAKKPRERRTELEEPETPPETKKPAKRRIEVEDEEPANAGIGKFIDALGGNKAEARAEAIDALSKMGGKAVPALEKAIVSADADVRKNALACLCKMGKTGRAAASTCIAALKDPSAEVRRNAAYALGRMAADSRETVAALTAALKDKDREVRLLAAFALEKAQGAK